MPLLSPLPGNEVRLLLGVIACNLGNLLRRLILPLAIQSWSLTSLQQRLFKIGGRLIRHAPYFTLRLTESPLTQRLFAQIIRRIERLAWALNLLLRMNELSDGVIRPFNTTRESRRGAISGIPG